MTINFSREDQQKFINALEQALKSANILTLQKIYLFNRYKSELVFSLDNAYRPFIGSTYGYNKNINDRVYIPENLKVFEVISDAYRSMNLDINGGRIFIGNDQVSYKKVEQSEMPLFYVVWGGGDLLPIIKKIFKEILEEKIIDFREQLEREGIYEEVRENLKKAGIF